MTKAAELAKMGEVLTNSQLSGRRNIVINGGMQVAQRATQVTGLGASGGYQTVDRWTISVGATSAGRFTIDQISDGPDGIANSTKLTCTTADTSIAAGELLQFQTKLEGQDLQQMNKGVASAKEVTVSFYVKGNAAATYSVEMHDRDNTRFNSHEFSVTTDWVRIVRTFAADADDGSSPYDDDNAVSMSLNFNLHGGSTYTGGSHTDNAWHETVNQRLGDNATSFFDATSRTFFITGVQMEVGSTATPFENRSFGEELNLCLRYFEKITAADGSRGISGYVLGGGVWYAANLLLASFHFNGVKRASPTMSTDGSDSIKAYTGSGSAISSNDGDGMFDLIEEKSARINFTPASNGTAGHGTLIQIVDGESVTIDAEL